MEIKGRGISILIWCRLCLWYPQIFGFETPDYWQYSWIIWRLAQCHILWLMKILFNNRESTLYIYHILQKWFGRDRSEGWCLARTFGSLLRKDTGSGGDFSSNQDMNVRRSLGQNIAVLLLVQLKFFQSIFSIYLRSPLVLVIISL